MNIMHSHGSTNILDHKEEEEDNAGEQTKKKNHSQGRQRKRLSNKNLLLTELTKMTTKVTLRQRKTMNQKYKSEDTWRGTSQGL